MKTKLSSEDLLYWENWQTKRDPEAGDYLVKKYLPLVEYVMQRIMISLPKTVKRDEVQSFAYEGLLDALDKFKVERDLKFETYAQWRIKGAIIDGLRQNDWLPRSVRDKVKKIEEAYVLLEQQKNQSVTDEEVSAYLGITKAELNKSVSDASLLMLISIDETIQDDDQNQVGRYNLIENSQAVVPEEYMIQKVIKEALTQAIDRLPEKEKLVVSLCYFEELKLTEIAEVLNLSVSRISQLHSKAMLRLHSAIVSTQDNY